MRLKIILLTLISTASMTSACTKQEDLNDAVQEASAEQVGDVMASIDEAGGDAGSFASLKMQEQKIFAKLAPGLAKPNSSRFQNLWLPKAQATSLTCDDGHTWGTCTNNVVTRTYDGCSLQSATISGTVTLTYDDSAVDNTCSLGADGDSIAREPNFTISGSRGAEYSVTKTGTFGQKVTRTSSGVFAFSNDGIRRRLSLAGVSLADFTTTTTSDIVITGTSRAGRVATGGTLHVVNNKTSESCDFTPSNLTWEASCTCPTSGSWTASCSDGTTGSLTITGCGTGTSVMNGESSSVSFNRCE